MSFLKCLCGSNNIKIFSIAANGFAKTKCFSCNFASTPEIKKENKKPVVMYKR